MNLSLLHESVLAGNQDAASLGVCLLGLLVLESRFPVLASIVPVRPLNCGVESYVWHDLVFLGNATEVGLDLGTHRKFLAPVWVQFEAVAVEV